VAKEGRNFRQLLDEILTIVDGPVSAEVVSVDKEGILKEARDLAAIHKNIVVKVPLIREGLKAVRQLTDEGIRTNVTLCFSPTQALLAAKAGATYVSPFVGRLDDISIDGMELIQQIVTIYQNYDFQTQVLAASIRHPLHVLDAALMGAHVATIPFKIIEQMFFHPLTDSGLQRFLDDWKKNETKLV
jgi:transaldolase